jgi:hypothetical protein
MFTKRAIFVAAIFICLILAPSFTNAGEYDLTQCYAGATTSVIASEKVTIFSFEHRAIATSNHSDKAFDNATFHCVGIYRMVNKEFHQIGSCKYQTPDGSTAVGEYNCDQRGGRGNIFMGPENLREFKVEGRFNTQPRRNRFLQELFRVVTGQLARLLLLPSNFAGRD